MRTICFAVLSAFLLAVPATQAGAASITIAPGLGPVGSYLPLNLFGITPTSIAPDSYHTFTVAPVVFAGQSWDKINVGENGLATLGSAGGTSIWSAPNASLPSGYLAPILAPLWTDVDATSGDIRLGVLTDGVDSWTVIEWAGVLVNSTPSSFQIWLGVGRDDTSFYYDALGTPSAFTIGAQDASGTVGTNYRLNGGSLPAAAGLVVVSEGLPVTSGPVVPEPATWAMMILGFGIIGAGLRKRRTVVTA